MSIRLMTLVWDVRWPTQNHLLVMLKLADHANDEGSKVWPSVSTLAEQAQCSERTVQNVLKALRDCKLASVVKAGGGAAPTIYALNVPLLRALAERKAELSGGADAIALPVEAYAAAGLEPPQTGATVAPGATIAPVQPATPTGATDDMTGAKLLHPNHHKEPLREPSLPPNPPPSGGSEGEGVLVLDCLEGLPAGTEHVRLCLARIATVLEIKHAKPAMLLAEIATALKPEPEPVLDELAGIVIRERKKIVSVKCVLDCLAKAHAAVPPMTIRDGDESYAAWVSHYANNRGMLSVARAHGFTVRSKWPPGFTSRAVPAAPGAPAGRVVLAADASPGRAVALGSGHNGGKP